MMQIQYDFALSELCKWLYPTVWYIFGGDDKNGVDCSGLVDGWWEAIGFWAVGNDATADKMFDNLRGDIKDRPIGVGTKLLVPQFGGLCFYGGSENYAGHVTIAISSEWCVGATGGSTSTDTIAEAKARDAKVKVHPIRYRDDYHGCWMPPYEFIGGPAAPALPASLKQLKATTTVNLRSAPKLSGSIVKSLATGTVMTQAPNVLPVVADGYTWLNVYDSAAWGWAASRYFVEI